MLAKVGPFIYRTFYITSVLVLVSALVFNAVVNSEKRFTIIAWLVVGTSLLLFTYFRKTVTRNDNFLFIKAKKLLKYRVDYNCRWMFRLSWLVMIFAFCGWFVYDAFGHVMRFRSFASIIVIYIVGILLSANPAKIKWRPVWGGLIFQLVLAFLFLRWSAGYEAFNQASQIAIKFLDFTFNGTNVAYGFLSNTPNICGMAPIFIYKQLQIIIYFGSMVAVLQYFGGIQHVLYMFASVMRIALDITSAESLNIVASVFIGTTEACLLIEPLIARMSNSEIHMIMTIGYACISGSLFAIYIGFGACPVHLLSATVMSAAVSISVSKLIYPEEKSTKDQKVEFPKRPETSVMECISNGATHTIKYVWAIAANLVVYTALLALLNSFVELTGNLVGIYGLSFNRLVGYMFFPITYLIGVSDAEDPHIAFDETLKVAELLGVKTTVNEFIAFMELSKMIKNAQLNGKRARMMTTFLLCGFTNIPMIGVQIGLLSSMCPPQNATFSKLAVRSFLTALISCLLTACVAGMLVSEPFLCYSTEYLDCINVDTLKSFLDNATTNSTNVIA